MSNLPKLYVIEHIVGGSLFRPEWEAMAFARNREVAKKWLPQYEQRSAEMNLGHCRGIRIKRVDPESTYASMMMGACVFVDHLHEDHKLVPIQQGTSTYLSLMRVEFSQ